MKVLIITPHLSTGGLPQYLWWWISQLQLPKEDILVVEYNFLSPHYVVQREKISKIATIESLGQNKIQLLNIIRRTKPDVIHIFEHPELFIDREIAKRIYESDIPIIESTHTSQFDIQNKEFLPDKFILPCEFSRRLLLPLNVDSDVVEYEYTPLNISKIEAQKYLGLDPSYKHVLNVGLFTPGKNQGELIELAKQFNNEKIIFHFVGNQAQNFEGYWKPLMENLPSNCAIWGERNDVDYFYAACDLFYFSSKLELNPLVIKEALSYNMPILAHKLTTYLDKYDGLITYIDNNEKQIISGLLNDYTNQPLISVVLSCKNTAKYFKDFFTSLELQTYKKWELWILDDNSSDNIRQHVIWAKNKYPDRVFYSYCDKAYQNWKNRWSATFVSGEIVFIPDSDDILSTNCLEVIANSYKDKDVSFTYGSYADFREDLSGEIHEMESLYPQEVQCKSIIDASKKNHQTIYNPFSYRLSAMLKMANEIEKMPSLILVDDMEFLSKMESAGFKYKAIKDIIYYKRIWNGNVTNLNNYNASQWLEKLNLVRDKCSKIEPENFQTNNCFSQNESKNTNKVDHFQFIQQIICKNIKSPKIKLVHLLSNPSSEREKRSIRCLAPMAQFGIDYIQHVNIPLTILPEQAKQKDRPNLNAGHLGCYMAFQSAIHNEFQDYDFLMICECDCKLLVSHNDFYLAILKACDEITKNKIDYFSFGDTKDLEAGVLQSEYFGGYDSDFAFETNKVIGIQSIMFPKSSKQFLLDKFHSEPWSGMDIWFNGIFKEEGRKIGIVKNRLTSQFDGVSLIDNKQKKLL